MLTASLNLGAAARRACARIQRCGTAPVRALSAAVGSESAPVGEAPEAAAAAWAAEDVEKPLAFVNRHAEALDVLVPNLTNARLLDRGAMAKFSSPLAVQPPGTGKTALGVHLLDILRRPRDPREVEAKELAPRLERAQCFAAGRALGRRHLAHALDADTDTGENLVVRTLLAAYPAQRDLILGLKNSTTVNIRMRELVAPDAGFSFDEALAYAIFCSARNMRGSSPATEAAFLAQDPTLQSARGCVQQLVKERGGAPVMLTLDDITDLGGRQFAEYFAPVPRSTPLHRAMSALSVRLQVLHRVRGCVIYLTGRSLWPTAEALVGATSTLFVTPVLLQPLNVADVRATMQRTLLPDGRALQDVLGVHPDVLQYFAEAAARLTGGTGRPLQYLLRTQVSLAKSWPRLALRSEADVDAALKRCMEAVERAPGLEQLRVAWGGPAAAVDAGDVPQWAQQRAAQLQVLQFLARLLLLDVAFPSYTTWYGLAAASWATTCGTGASGTARVVDLATALGINHVPAGDGSGKVRLHASSWLCHSLARDPALLESPRTLVTARMLDAMQTCSGTMRGRPFELLCAEALCFRHMMLLAAQQQRTLQQHTLQQQAEQQPLKGSRAPPSPATATPAADHPPTLGTLLPQCASTKLGASILEQLNVVAMPAVTSAATATAAAPMDERAKAAMKARWQPSSQQPASLPPRIHTDDLPWLLTSCLPAGSLAVPVAAQSGAQDLFLRVSGGVVGFALKAAEASNGTNWQDVQEELRKAPVREEKSKSASLPEGESYVLVLWSLNLAPKLQAALQQRPSRAFGPGTWVLGRGGRLRLQRRARTGSSSAAVATGSSAAAAANRSSTVPATVGDPPGTGATEGSSATAAHRSSTAPATEGSFSAVATARKPAAAKGPAVAFTVPKGMELVIANPHADGGGGLAQLLGPLLLRQLQAAPPALAGIDALTAWMAMEATSLTHSST